METKANYALIGLFVLLTFLAGIGFVAWLSNQQFDQQFERYDVVFNGPVRGLTQGGEVRFNGLRVGEVVRLSLDPDDSNSVVAQIQIDANTPVHTNSRAQLEPQGLTGLSYIQIFSGGDEFPLLTELSDGPYIIPGEDSPLTTLLDDGGSVLEQAQRALLGINQTLSPEATADFQSILANVNTITGRLAEAELDSDAISSMIDSFTRAADEVAVTAETVNAVAADVQSVVREDVDLLVARIETTLDNVDAVLASSEGVVTETEVLVVDIREAVNRLSNSGLTDLEETTDSLRQLVTTLNRIALQLERSPSQFFVGEARQTVEIPQ